MLGLAILLADGNNRGGGDLRSEHPIIGSWAGDRIVIAGDYADPGKHLTEAEIAAWTKKNKKRAAELAGYQDGDARPDLYEVAEDSYENISFQVLQALCDDSYIKEDLRANLDRWGDRGMLKRLGLTRKKPEAGMARVSLRPDMVLGVPNPSKEK